MSTDKRSIDWYNNNADNYTAHVRNPDDSVFHSLYEKPAMYALLPDLNGKKVISIGCGSGEDSNNLKTRGAAQSVGIDIAEKLIEIAAASYPACEFRQMDMEHLDFPDESFDFAYSSLAIHYLKDWTPAFKEIFRILKPQSYFLFSCEHPLPSAMVLTENTDEVSVRALAIKSFKKSETTEILGDYLGSYSLGISGQLDVTTWHKPLSIICDEFSAAGFVLEKFVEPLPLKEMETVSPRSYAKLTKIPFFAIFKLVKR